ALAAMPPDARPWMALAGDGPLRADIERRSVAAGLGHDLRLLGERGDVAQLMQAADFLVLPSSLEGMSNVLMEAMSLGCPVVASAVGGNTELVEDGATGLLDRKSTRLNSSHVKSSYAVFCLKKKMVRCDRIGLNQQ